MWSPQEIDRMVFEESDTDRVLAMPLPLTDFFKGGLYSRERCAELARPRPRP